MCVYICAYVYIPKIQLFFSKCYSLFVLKTGKAETSTNGSLAIDEKTQWILEEIESRRYLYKVKT